MCKKEEEIKDVEALFQCWVIILVPALHSGQPRGQESLYWSKCFFFVVFLFSAAHLNTHTDTHTAKPLCLYTIAFSVLLLIKVDSYTCWIKRNITMMYFSCIIYDGCPARAMVPEVICLPIHYSRQIAGSLCRVSSFILLLLCNFFFFVCVFRPGRFMFYLQSDG